MGEWREKMNRSTKCFLLGMMSVFSFGRVRLYVSNNNFWDEIETDFQDINPFLSDTDAMRCDFEKVGSGIQKAIIKYEQQKTPTEQRKITT